MGETYNSEVITRNNKLTFFYSNFTLFQYIIVLYHHVLYFAIWTSFLFFLSTEGMLHNVLCLS